MPKTVLCLTFWKETLFLQPNYFPTISCSPVHYTSYPMGQSIQENGPSKIYGRQPLKNFTLSTLEYLVPYAIENYVSYFNKVYSFS